MTTRAGDLVADWWPATKAGRATLELCGIILCLAITAALLGLLAIGVALAYRAL